MARRVSRQRQAPSRRPSRQRSSKLTPFHLVLFGVGLLVVLGAFFGFSAFRNRTSASEVQPTVLEQDPEQSDLEQESIVDSTATPEPLPTDTPTPEPTIICRLVIDSAIYGEATVNSVGQQVASGTELEIYEQIIVDNQAWYRINRLGEQRFIPARGVDCGN